MCEPCDPARLPRLQPPRLITLGADLDADTAPSSLPTVTAPPAPPHRHRSTVTTRPSPSQRTATQSLPHTPYLHCCTSTAPPPPPNLHRPDIVTPSSPLYRYRLSRYCHPKLDAPPSKAQHCRPAIVALTAIAVLPPSPPQHRCPIIAAPSSPTRHRRPAIAALSSPLCYRRPYAAVDASLLSSYYRHLTITAVLSPVCPRGFVGAGQSSQPYRCRREVDTLSSPLYLRRITVAAIPSILLHCRLAVAFRLLPLRRHRYANTDASPSLLYCRTAASPLSQRRPATFDVAVTPSTAHQLAIVAALSPARRR